MTGTETHTGSQCCSSGQRQRQRSFLAKLPKSKTFSCNDMVELLKFFVKIKVLGWLLLISQLDKELKKHQNTININFSVLKIIKSIYIHAGFAAWPTVHTDPWTDRERALKM